MDKKPYFTPLCYAKEECRQIRVLPPQPEKEKSSQAGWLFSFLFTQGAGLEPIAEELSGGQFLPPVQKLVATIIVAQTGNDAYQVLPPQP